MIFYLLISLLLVACGNTPYRGCEVVGADDLVMDSYRIREGKFAILEMEGEEIPESCEETFQEWGNRIQDGDLLAIGLHHPTRGDLAQTVAALSQTVGFEVRQGQLKLPGLEPIAVGGMTLEEAQKQVEKAYCREIQDTEIFLSYRSRAQQKVELIGCVATASVHLEPGMRLFDVLSQARLSPGANLFKSYVVRGEKMLPVDLQRLVRDADMTQNIPMHPGDRIYIAEPSASSFMVLGEVGRERVVDLPNGTMTLRQALAEAGGIPYTGDKRYIQVIRGNLRCPKIYTVRWEHIVRLPSNSLLVIPGDIVYVAAKPIAEWNRFVGQVLPTLVGADILLRGVKNVGLNLP